MRPFSIIFLLILLVSHSYGQQNKDEDFQNRKDYALLFALDAYDDWQNLDNPIHDVNTIATELKKYYGFEVEIVENYTKEELFLKLKEYEEKSYKSYDQLLIYFAGHGLYDESLNQGFLVCKDSKSEDNTRNTYISPYELTNTIDRIPIEHTLVILDVCRESIMPPEKITQRRNPDTYTNLSREEIIKINLKYKTRKYITSGSIQYTQGQAGKHSPFSRKIIECLRSYGGMDRLLPLREINGWLLDLRIEPTAGSFGSNEPGSNFVFVAK